MNAKPVWDKTNTLSRLEREIRRQDPIDLPMDENFFDQLHDKIMDSVEKTEVKPLSRWAKTWVFLEQRARRHREVIHSSVKSIFMGGILALGWGALQMSAAYYAQAELKQKEIHKTKIMQAVEKEPLRWAELASTYQSESDLYAEVLSQRLDLETIKEINKVIDQDL